VHLIRPPTFAEEFPGDVGGENHFDSWRGMAKRKEHPMLILSNDMPAAANFTTYSTCITVSNGAATSQKVCGSASMKILMKG
jgi:hypothetical protein